MRVPINLDAPVFFLTTGHKKAPPKRGVDATLAMKHEVAVSVGVNIND